MSTEVQGTAAHGVLAATADLDLRLPFVREVPPEAYEPIGEKPLLSVAIDIGSDGTAFLPWELEGTFDPSAPFPDIPEQRRLRSELCSHNFSKNQGSANVEKEVTRVAIQSAEACAREHKLDIGDERVPLRRRMHFGKQAFAEYHSRSNDYAVYNSFKLPLNPDSSERRPNDSFVRAEHVTCDAVLGVGRVSAVELFALTVGECVRLACRAGSLEDVGPLRLGLLCPENWDDATKIAVESAILRLQIQIRTGRGMIVRHLRRGQLVWISEAHASFFSAVLDVHANQLPVGESIVAEFDVGGHTVDMTGATVEKLPDHSTRIRNLLLHHSCRFGGNDVNQALWHFLYLNVLLPLGLTHDVLARNKKPVFTLKAGLEKLKVNFDPLQIATTDAMATDPFLKTHFELELRKLDEVFQGEGQENWRASLARHVQSLNAQRQLPLPFVQPNDARFHVAPIFRDILAQNAYVQSDETGSFEIEGALLKVPAKLVQLVMNLHAQALQAIVSDFILNLNEEQYAEIPVGGTLDLRPSRPGGASSIEVILFTGDGATGLAHRQIKEPLSKVHLSPNQTMRLVEFPRPVSSHCLKGGLFVLLHHGHVQPFRRSPWGYGARLNILCLDEPNASKQPYLLKEELPKAGVSEAIAQFWKVLQWDPACGGLTVDVIVPAIQPNQIIRVNQSYQFGRPGDTFRLPANSILQLDLYCVARRLPQLQDELGAIPLLISRREPQPNDGVTPPTPPENLPILSYHKNGVARYLYRHQGPECLCRTFIRFSEQGHLVVELQIVRRDGDVESTRSHVMKVCTPAQAALQNVESDVKVKREHLQPGMASKKRKRDEEGQLASAGDSE